VLEVLVAVAVPVDEVVRVFVLGTVQYMDSTQAPM
jgi:hypothetical protein